MLFEEIAQRSSAGCSTCRKRKKKCDETRPVCRRCIDGDFRCLGYENIVPSGESRATTIAIPQLLPLKYSNVSLCSSSGAGELMRSAPQAYEDPRHRAAIFRKKERHYLPTVTQPMAIKDIYSFAVSRQIEFASRTIFRPARISIQDAVTHEAQGHKLKLWSLFVGAKIFQAFSDGRNENYTALIEGFHVRIQGASATNGSSTGELQLKLSCLEDLVLYAGMALGSQSAYRLLQQTLPVFVQLAMRYPHLWSLSQAISISRVLYHSPDYHMCKFVFYDTMGALVFARPPLVIYDTRSIPTYEPQRAMERAIGSALEFVYGCTIPTLILLAKINSWRAGIGVERWSEDWRQLESEAMQWSFWADHEDDSMGRVMRLAIQESWRQAALIYLYMGMCGADSADVRVAAAVKQVVNLVEMVSKGDVLENHLFMPCLIAGVAARHESHRQILRRKLTVSKNENVWCLPGADFVPVLDKLWHEVGRDGRPLGWDHYAKLVAMK